MIEIIPTEQKVYLQSQSTKLFKYNNPQSKYFLSENLNSLNRVFGSDFLISGLNVKNHEINNNVLTLTISSGEMVLDYTYINYPEDTVITFPLENLNINDEIIIVCSFKNSLSPIELLSKIKLFILRNGNTLENFFHDIDRLVLGRFKKTNTGITLIPTYLLAPETITINEKEYIIRNPDNISKRILNYMNYKFEGL